MIPVGAVLVLTLGVTGDADPDIGICRWRRPECTGQAIERPMRRFDSGKVCRVDDDDAMRNVPLVSVRTLSVGTDVVATAEYRTEDLDHQTQTVTLVAAELRAVTTRREQPARLAGQQFCDQSAQFGRLFAETVDGPSDRYVVARPMRKLELSHGDGGG